MHWIKDLQDNPEHVISRIYKDHRDEALAWMAKYYSLKKEDALDVFQNSVTALYQNATLGKINRQNVELKTYLFSICKNLAIKLQSNKKLSIIDVFDIPEMAEDQDSRVIVESKIRKCLEGLEQLSETCIALLKSFYLKGLKIPEIAKIYDYSSEDSAKTQKYKCLKKLRLLVNTPIVALNE